MTRWVLVLMAIYTLVGIAGRCGLYVVVAAYARGQRVERARARALRPPLPRPPPARRAVAAPGGPPAGGDAATDLGQHGAPEQLESREDVVLRHPRPADPHGRVRHAGPVLREERLDHLGRRADREAIRGQAAELRAGGAAGSRVMPGNPPGRGRPRTSSRRIRRRPADRRVLVGRARDLDQAARRAGSEASPPRRGRCAKAAAWAANSCTVGTGTTSQPSAMRAARAIPAGTCEPTRIGGRGCWIGPRADRHAVEPPVTAVMGDVVLGPEPPDDLDPLAEPADPLGHRHAEDGELLGPVAEPHPEEEPAAGDHVQEGADLRDLDGVVERQEDQVRADPEPLGLGREALEEREQGEVVEARAWRGAPRPRSSRSRAPGSGAPARPSRRIGAPGRRPPDAAR